MSRFPKLALAAVAGLFAVGCQTSNKPAESSLVTSDKGVVCEKCKTTWVKVPTHQSGSPNRAIIGYTTQKNHECPDCRGAVANFFATGELKHDCKTCGPDSLKICEQH